MDADRQRTYDKRDRLRQFRAFCHAARLGNITRAAEYLDISPQAVSAHLRQLELELAAILFDRAGPGTGLTSAGEKLYELAMPLVQGLDALSDDFMERVDDNVHRPLQIAANVAGASSVLPPYIKQFRDQNPYVRLRVRNCPPREGWRLLLDDEVEIMLGVKDYYPEDTLEYRHLLPFDIVLITSMEHPLAGRETASPEEVRAWPAISPPAGTHSQQFDESIQQFGVDVEKGIEVRGWSVIKRYVENGLGIALVPSISVHDTDRLSVIPLKDYFRTRSFGVFTRRGEHLTPPARRFLGLLTRDIPDSATSTASS